MPSPPKEPSDALSAAIAGVLRRLEETERRLARLEEALGFVRAEPEPFEPGPSVSTPGPPAVPAESELGAFEDTHPEPSIPTSRAGSDFETRVGLTWVNRLGVITLVLGVAFFFKYAVDNEWIGESGRVVLGILSGLAALGIAERLWRRGHKVYAQGISGSGIAVLYLSFYASFGFYQLLPLGWTFPLMAVTTAAAGALAIRYDSVVIAVLGLLGGYATPLLLSTGEDRPWFLFGYVLILSAGALAVARAQGWKRLELFAFLATVFLYVSWFEDRFTTDKRLVATCSALLYYALFTLVDLPLVLAASQILAVLAILAIWTQQLTYLPLAVALCAAGLFVADRRAWPGVATATFGSFWALYFAWHGNLGEPCPVGGTFVALTAAFLLFHGWLPWRVLVRRSEPCAQDLLLLALNGPLYFSACYTILRAHYEPYLGLFAVALGGLHLLSGIRLREQQPSKTGETLPALLSMGVALAFVTLAVPIQFSGYRITMAWVLEGSALCWITTRIEAGRLRYAALAVFLLALFRLSLVDAGMYSSPADYRAILNLRFLTFLVAALSFWGAAYWIRSGWTALATYITGHLVMLWALGLEVLGWAARTAAAGSLDSVKSASLSILIASYALILVGIGALASSAVNRILGLALVGLVVLKLYLYDVWLLHRVYRVTAFAVLGFLLLLTSYVYSRYRTSIENWWKNRNARPGPG